MPTMQLIMEAYTTILGHILEDQDLSLAMIFQLSSHLCGLSINIAETDGPTGGFQSMERFLGRVPLA